MLKAADFRRIAWEKYKNQWLIAMLVGLVAGILGGDMGNADVQSRMDVTSEQVEQYVKWVMDSDYTALIAAVVASVGLFLIILTLIQLVIGGAISLGYAKFNLSLIDGEEPNGKELFSCLDRLWNGFCLRFFKGLFIFLWSLLLVIPGIVAAYRYAMAEYIMLENPGMGALEAIKESKRLMDGNKSRLFCLDLSFIGWDILGMITLGIGMIFVRPYENAAHAAFYREITRAR